MVRCDRQGPTVELRWPYGSGESESERKERRIRVLPNGSAFSCRPPVSVPGSLGRPPATRPGITDRAPPAAGRWDPSQAERWAAGQLQCLVRPRDPPQPARRGNAREPEPELSSPEPAWSLGAPPHASRETSSGAPTSGLDPSEPSVPPSPWSEPQAPWTPQGKNWQNSVKPGLSKSDARVARLRNAPCPCASEDDSGCLE